ncbi:MAG: aspartate kinase [Oscillospiraceae bacterium]|nr:aspartate kinase [Oscillospiraceae bacterium]
MALVVMKFGGSSVADNGRLMNAAKLITDCYRDGNEVVAVVSAQGDTTDELIEKAEEIDAKPSKREMDMLLSSGEQVSSALLAIAVGRLGCKAVSMTGWQAGFRTSSTFSTARIRSIDTSRVRRELDDKNIVIIAGFQGVSEAGDITTLGRGGSDTSAVAVAAALGADCCIIYTDVEGVFTADPRLVKTALKLAEISFDEMLELASLGAQVLQNRSVELAKKYNVNLEVRSSATNNAGTAVREVVKMEGMLVKGITKDSNVVAVSVLGVPDKPGVAFKIFSLLGQKRINVDIILQSEGRDGAQDITFTVASADKDSVRQILEENLSVIGGSGVKIDESVAKVSIVGAGMQSHSGVASRVFGALYGADINIHMISTSEIKISVLINSEHADRAVAAIHDEFVH